MRFQHLLMLKCEAFRRQTAEALKNLEESSDAIGITGVTNFIFLWQIKNFGNVQSVQVNVCMQ